MSILFINAEASSLTPQSAVDTAPSEQVEPPVIFDSHGTRLPRYESAPDSRFSDPSSETLTDAGNARRFARENGSELRYCKKWRTWFVWDGKRWCIDGSDHVMLLAKRTAQRFLSAAVSVSDSGVKKAQIHHALASESEPHLRAMISLAKSEPPIPVTPYEVDGNNFLLNCNNGTLDLSNGVLCPHDPRQLLTKLAPVDFDPKAACPTFNRMLRKILGGDAGLIEYMQRCIGYSLTGSVKEQALFFLWGDGSNGKTTFLEVIKMLLGDYAGQLPMESLMMKANEGISNDIAQLKGRRFVTSTEVEQGRRLAESRVKTITGGGTLQARHLYQDLFEFTPTHKIFMDGNHKPQIVGTDTGIWRRIKLIPFTVTIEDHEKDRDLANKLTTELSGILRWAVEGCLRWQEDGLGEPVAVTAEVRNYREEMDRFPDFIRDECELGKSLEATNSELRAAYSRWASEESATQLNPKNFAQKLRGIGAEPWKSSSARGWKGIRLKGREGA